MESESKAACCCNAAHLHPVTAYCGGAHFHFKHVAGSHWTFKLWLRFTLAATSNSKFYTVTSTISSVY